jgi:NAD(P)-dependent dehydrogenase (short-subunit alcohol dehydrogenase family)
MEGISLMATAKKPVAVVVGAGDALGSAVARRFAREGYNVCAARRSAEKLNSLVEEIRSGGGAIRPFGTDARKEDQVADLFATIEHEEGEIEVVVFNVGPNVQFDIRSTEAKKYFKVWEIACYAGFLVGREAAKIMTPRGRGTILFSGATASWRGNSGFSAFAGGKHGLRALAESMAKELGPQGIHVAHIVIDGSIDTEFIKRLFPDRYALKAADGILNPDHIAENYWHIHKQPRTAWTFEMDLRPYMEKW